MTRLGRGRTFKVWLVDRAEIGRAHYEARAVPAIGETIRVRKMKRERDGSWRTSEAELVPARVTQVRSGIITAAIDYEA